MSVVHALESLEEHVVHVHGDPLEGDIVSVRDILAKKPRKSSLYTKVCVYVCVLCGYVCICVYMCIKVCVCVY